MKANKLITSPLTPQILPGITRHIVLELAKKHQIPIKERPILESELYTADEVWVTASNKEIYPITQINETVVAKKEVGPLWKKMIRLYQHYKAQGELLW